MDPTLLVRGAVALLGGWRSTLFAALCVALGATALLQSARLDNAQAEIVKFEVAVARFKEAQATNLSTIDDLRETNQAWARSCALDPTAAEEAAAATEQASGALPADDQRRESERGELYVVDQSAAAWGRERVPPAVASRLRK